jgi:hypothetical protein
MIRYSPSGSDCAGDLEARSHPPAQSSSNPMVRSLLAFSLLPPLGSFVSKLLNKWEFRVTAFNLRLKFKVLLADDYQPSLSFVLGS